MSRGLTKQGATGDLGTPLPTEGLPKPGRAEMGESLSGGGKLTGCV